MRPFLLSFLIALCGLLRAQDTLRLAPLPAQYKALEKYNEPLKYQFDSVTVYAICTGFVSTDQQFPEPVFVWLIKTPLSNFLVDAGLPPGVNDAGYFTGMSGSFFQKKFTFYLYKSNDLVYQLNKLGATDLSAIILTHGHFDHIGYLNKLSTQKLYVTAQEKKEIEAFGQLRGYKKNTAELINFKRAEAVELNCYKTAAIDKHLVLVRTDEHTLGHQMIMLLSGQHKILFTGDVDLRALKKESELYSFLDKAYGLKDAVLFFNHDKQLFSAK